MNIISRNIKESQQKYRPGTVCNIVSVWRGGCRGVEELFIRLTVRVLRERFIDLYECFFPFRDVGFDISS